MRSFDPVYMKEEDIKLLKNYLAGSASPENSKYIRNLLVNREGDPEIKQLLFDEWKKTPDVNQSAFDIDDVWDELSARLQNDEDTKSKSLIIWKKSLLVAASAIVLLATVFIFIQQAATNEANLSTVKKFDYIIKKTDKGEKLNISLPDGSFIKLNSSTTLQIPANYNTSDERVVYLEGEAFFEVAKDNGKPFKVISREVTTEVMGTSFNVSAFREELKVKVALVEGKVKVSEGHNEIFLKPNEMASVGSGNILKSGFDVDAVTGWRNNLLVFNKVSFMEILAKLSQWYGVEFVLVGGESPAGTYSGRFENKALPLVLEGLGFSSEFDYKVENKVVYLNFK